MGLIVLFDIKDGGGGSEKQLDIVNGACGKPGVTCFCCVFYDDMGSELSSLRRGPMLLRLLS